jgi:hypothetical protein
MARASACCALAAGPIACGTEANPPPASPADAGDATGVDAGGSDGGGGDRDAGGPPSYACTLVLGVSATGEWIDQGGFLDLVDGARFEARTKTHAFVELWPGDTMVWTQPFNPGGPAPQPGGAPRACAEHPDAPDRVLFVAYTDPHNPTYQSQSGWETALEQDIATLQAKYPSVTRIELLTMVRGPLMKGGMTYPGGFNCDPSLEEDIVAPHVDQAIAAEAARHPGLVFAGPKFYVGDCSWWTPSGAGRGPHFVPDGQPALEAQKIADYYGAGTCASPWCVP